MKNLHKLSITAFGDFQSFTADSERIIRIMEKLTSEGLGDFLPTTIFGKYIDVDKGVISDDRRMVFTQTSSDSTVTIELPAERINVNIQYQDDTEINNQILKLSLEKCEILMNLILSFLEAKANRLALNVFLLSENLNRSDVSRLAKEFIKIDSYYAEEEISEFNLLYNTVKKIRISEDEPINVIRNIHIVNNSISQRLMTLVDVNTSQTDLRFRFSNTSIRQFIKQTGKLLIVLSGLENEETN